MMFETTRFRIASSTSMIRVAVVPSDDSVTSRIISVVTNPPRYGMYVPRNTSTASGPASGTPSTNMNTNSVTALIAARTVVPRR